MITDFSEWERISETMLSSKEQREVYFQHPKEVNLNSSLNYKIFQVVFPPSV